LKRALYPRASWGFWPLAYIQGIKEERDVPTPRRGHAASWNYQRERMREIGGFTTEYQMEAVLL